MTNMLGDFGWCLENIGDPFQILRAKPEVLVNGRAQARETLETIDGVGSIQPMTQKELDRMPEGMRNKGWVKYYGPTELRSVDTSAARVADVIVYNGVQYQVETVDHWIQAGYYKATLTRLGT